MKTRFNWSTDTEIVEMLTELAASDDRKPSQFLSRLVKQEYTAHKYQQRKVATREQ